MRGEDPAAIRIIDLTPTKRTEAIEANIDFVKTDVTDDDAVSKAFKKPWPKHVESLPLTVFHCVAYIRAADRHSAFVPLYQKVNIIGTKNVLEAAQAAGASCFIATSSASNAARVPSFWPAPWTRWSKDIYQLLPNAEPASLDAPLSSFVGCYSWSKAQAEKLVRSANNPEANFYTGCLRPAHAIYGHGVENPSSITWDYLRRGGSPTWIAGVVSNFVNAQNVSIGHLAYENAILNKTNPGGKAYCVTDPNPPLQYSHLYETLITCAHPLTPISFKPVPHIMMLLISYMVEAYVLLRHYYLPFLPPVDGDLTFLQPATFQLCTVNLVFTDTDAQKEIGYRAPIDSKEGFALAVVDWNKKIEENARKKIDAGEGGDVLIQEENGVPKAPNVH